jgi:membrane protease YdiL (CAAX protease family)
MAANLVVAPEAQLDVAEAYVWYESRRIGLGEEFFFRGLLQQWFGAWMRSEVAGLIAASIAFGAVHLWFRAFPNWRFAVLAAVAGVFYGLAYRRAKSIRASMVTHALVVTTWRVFF